jgi:nicotinate-nucleotide pyrophosphorylase (carboxylating)
MNITLEQIRNDIQQQVAFALKEDIGSGDITAELIPETQQAKARVITREAGVLCGQAWVDEVYRQLDPQVKIQWQVKDGETVTANQVLFTLQGSARSLLTGERTALNFLQTLSGTATLSRQYADLVKHSQLKILDTRKTLPGLRSAQKYSVSCGGCDNHRIGLYDAFLIKENHIAACGSIAAAVKTARQNHPELKVEVEVENIDEFQQAQMAGADIIMLDNFTLPLIEEAVKHRNNTTKIEVSGGLGKEDIQRLAQTGVDFISIGALTKNCKALDLSFRIIG